MKELAIAILSIFIFGACTKNTGSTRTQNETLIGEIDSLLTNWHLAAAEANFNNYFDLMDSISVFVGTDASEVWSKEKFQEFSKPHFDNGTAWDFCAIERNIYLGESADFIWFDELLNTWMGLCRGSGVFEETNGGWKLKHYVLSVAIPNEVIREVVKVKAERDSLFLQSIHKDN